MQKVFSKQTLLPLLFVLIIAPAFSQDSSMTMKPIKKFSTFSIGINAGVLAPVAPSGGSNNFTKWKPTLGYGLYLKNQFTHYLAVQADFLRGNLEGNNDNALGNGQPSSNPYQSFKTNLNWAASLSGVVTFGNINWLSDKSAVIPYVSLGGGIAGYKPVLQQNGTSIQYKTDGKDIQEFFVPVGAGLKIAAAQNLNVDLGFRMNYVDGDNLDGYVKGFHKDKFTYGFAGLEFAFGNKPQLMTDNPVKDFKRDLMDENNALKASVAASQQQSASEIDALKNEITALKSDADKDGVADYLDKCPNTPDSVKVDGSGCPLPVVAPPPPPPATVIITEEDRRTVDEAIKDLQFETGKSAIKPSSYASLDRVAQVLINKNFSLKLAGHTDNVGSDNANMKLSKDRAESVKDYLVSKGANSSRIEATGYGETQPIASNKTADGRAKNRRVEFTLF
ncbi:MAG: OmpA family protein [Parafilimonas sp.]